MRRRSPVNATDVTPLSWSPRWTQAGGHGSSAGGWKPRASRADASAQGDLSCDAILGDHLLIELEAEAWARRHWHEAVLEPRPVCPQSLPDRIAVGIGEALKIGAVWHGGDEVLGNLAFLVVRHLYARCPALGRCAPPVGDATALGNVVVDEVHGTRIEQPAHAVAGDLRLPGVDGDARRSPHAGHAGDVVVPVAGLLEPGDVEGLDEARETDRLIGRPAAVGIDGKHKVLTRRLAGSGNALCIVLGR